MSDFLVYHRALHDIIPPSRRLITAVENENYDYDGLRGEAWKGETWTVPPLLLYRMHTLLFCGRARTAMSMAASSRKLGKTEPFVSRRTAAKSIRLVAVARREIDRPNARNVLNGLPLFSSPRESPM